MSNYELIFYLHCYNNVNDFGEQTKVTKGY